MEGLPPFGGTGKATVAKQGRRGEERETRFRAMGGLMSGGRAEALTLTLGEKGANDMK